MKFKRILSICTAMLILATFFAGCTKKGEENNPSGTNSGVVDGIDRTKAMKLNLGLPGSFDVTNEEIVNSFKAKYPNIEVTLDNPPWGDFTKKIAAQIAGGNAPDVWLQENAAILGYGKMGAAVDLTSYIDKYLKKDEYVDTLFASKVGDKVWGVPHGVNPVALAYNKKVFDAAGVAYPTDKWTYQDMIDAAKKLTKDGVYGFLTGGSITVGWFPWIKSAGGMALDAKKENAVFDDAKAIKGIQAWADTVNKDKISPSIAQQNDMGKAATMFGQNKAAMMFVQYSEIATSLKTKFPDLDYDTVMIPKTFDGSGRFVPVVANSWLIYSRASDSSKDAAWLWIEHYLSKEMQEVIAKSGATLPINKKALEMVDNLDGAPKNRKAFTQGIAEAGVTMDENAKWNDWRIAAQPIFQEILNGTIPVEKGLKDIKTKVQAILEDKQ